MHKRDNRPRVSIGLPVYNGERFLEATVESICGQTFGDFELIISDNASTDGTESICRKHASADKRIRYLRNASNRGAAYNFNRVFQLSKGEYFKWAAHDDVYAPTYLENCVAGLDWDPSAVLCFPKVRFIDESGAMVDDHGYKARGLNFKPHERFVDIVLPTHIITEIFGLIRAECLKQTPLIAGYASSDRVLLGELALHGRFVEIPDYLFFHREHAERSANVFVTLHSYLKWFAPDQADKVVFPTWKLLGEHLLSISRAPLNATERLRCYLGMARWVRSRRCSLISDVGIALKQTIGRPMTQQA
jgi:glycosyltransferase involved in cell wall biosynthesis